MGFLISDSPFMFDDLAEAIQHAIVGLGPGGITCLQLAVLKQKEDK